MDSLHPIIRPPDVGHEPHNPVRDPGKLAPTATENVFAG